MRLWSGLIKTAIEWASNASAIAFHIAELNLFDAEYQARDTMGVSYTGVLPADKRNVVASMWAAAQVAPAAEPEPHALTAGTR
eukprot:3205092-Amphidinium_carterae.1